MSALAIAGFGVCASGFPNAAAFAARSGSADAFAPSGALLDKPSRRRASALTKAFADAYQEALDAAGFAPSEVASVFGSALGEAGTMISLLDQMWKQGGALSPMRFAASVHNTASGVISISTKNVGLTTAIGADFDTPAMALCEALGIALTHELPVIVVCGDEAAPLDLVGEDQGWGYLCCALALAPIAQASSDAARIGAPYLAREQQHVPEAQLPDELAHNPQAGLLDLIDAIARGMRGRVRLDRGRGRGYCVDLTGPQP